MDATANLFFVLQYIAVLAVHFENFASGRVFVKRIPRRNIFGERNDKGFHLFLRNLKGVLSSMQKWWGLLDRGFDRGDYAERLQDSILHLSAQMTSPPTQSRTSCLQVNVLIIHWHCFQVSYARAQLAKEINLHRKELSNTFWRKIRNMLIIGLCNSGSQNSERHGPSCRMQYLIILIGL